MMCAKVIGLVGYPGSGKTFISHLMERYCGFWVFDADKIGHAVLQDKTNEVAEKLGEKILDEKGSIDRSALADIVFDDVDKLNALNYIVHPEIFKCAKDDISIGGSIVLDAALLFEIGLDKLCDEVWFVDTPFQIRFRRVKKRGWSAKELLRRELHFFSEEDLRDRCDRALLNVGPTETILSIIQGFLS